MFDAIDVANYIICYLKQRDKYISSLKLQKILYYVAAGHYQKTGNVLFSDTIEKWKFGPVVPSVYHAFKNYGYMAIREPVTRYNIFLGNVHQNDVLYPPALDDSPYINCLIDSLVEINVNRLVEYTHLEYAWESQSSLILAGISGLTYSPMDLMNADLSFVG